MLYLETATCLGTSSSSKEHASAKKKYPLWILQQQHPAGSPLPKSVCGHQRDQNPKTVRSCQPRNALSLVLLLLQELPDILDSCDVELNHMGEEWPNLYIGNM